MKAKKVIVVLMLCAFFVPNVAFGASPWTEAGDSRAQVKEKLGFGLKNLLGGWTAILKRPSDYRKEGKNMYEGFGVGLFDAIAYTAGGALHTVTFFLPGIDIPVKDNGVTFE